MTLPVPHNDLPKVRYSFQITTSETRRSVTTETSTITTTRTPPPTCSASRSPGWNNLHALSTTTTPGPGSPTPSTRPSTPNTTPGWWPGTPPLPDSVAPGRVPSLLTQLTRSVLPSKLWLQLSETLVTQGPWFLDRSRNEYALWCVITWKNIYKHLAFCRLL